MTPEDRKEYLLKVGNKEGRNILTVIDKLRPFINAMESEIGKALLDEDITDHAHLLNQIYDSIVETGAAKQEDVIRLKVVHARLVRIYAKLKSYADCVGTIQMTIRKGEGA